MGRVNLLRLESSIKIPLLVAKPLKVADALSKIRAKAITRAKRQNNSGTLPIWGKEEEKKENTCFSVSSDEEDNATHRDFDKNGRLKDHGEHTYAQSFSERLEDQTDPSSDNYEASAENPALNRVYSDPISSGEENEHPDDQEQSEEEEVENSLPAMIGANQSVEEKKVDPSAAFKKGNSAYIKMIASELQKTARRSAYVDEEAEEEGVEVPNDFDEISQEAGLASNFISEIQDLIDDEEDGKNDGSSLHQSMFARQMISESLEESEMIARLLEEKKQTRLSNLALKRKYGRRAATSVDAQKEDNHRFSSPMAVLHALCKYTCVILFSCQ